MPLTGVPIVEHHVYEPTVTELSFVERVLRQVQSENPQLHNDDRFEHLVPDRLDEAPAVHIDDFSEIGGIEGHFDVRHLQDRARLRAADGDIVVSGCVETPGYEDYCDCVLGLGLVRWLHPDIPKMSTHIAGACWQDRDIRRALVHAARSDGLRYVHPHLGTFAVWELADLLHQSSRQPIHVIAPPPEVSRLVNNKVLFSNIVENLFGQGSVPATRSAWNRTSLAAQVKELACECAKLGIKLPDSAGSRGNVVLNGQSLRDCSTEEVFAMLAPMLKSVNWDGQKQLLVDCWEPNVLSSPSVQTWIPPTASGQPVIEGLFDQQTSGVTQRFVGARYARLTDALRNDLVRKSTILAWLFQQLGYVGRCSFDTIVTGDDLEHGRIEFVECNGRWGGTSLPMTLMNRLHGDWTARPYVTAYVRIPGLDRLSFATLLKEHHSELFQAATRSGSLLLFTPGRIAHQSAIDVLAMGETEEAARVNCEVFVDRLRHRLAAADPVTPRQGQQHEQQPASESSCPG
ncbi:MAG: hypothetical protein HQ518_31885 [Rhodopirellula sp.]|nr:hypothetical protein [Rhodopirellula sp.]